MLWVSRIPDEVMDRWSEILKERGLDEEKAENIVAWICGDPRLILGKPNEVTIEVVKERLGKISLGVEDEENVKEEMIKTLESWIKQETEKPLEVVHMLKEFPAEVPVLYSPPIKVPKALEEKNPEDIIISDILEHAWEEIQKDFEEHGLETVLQKFAKSVVGAYENFLKFVIFGSYNDHEREILYKALIKNRISEILKALRKR